MSTQLEDLFTVWKIDPKFEEEYQQVLFEEARDLAELEEGYKKLPKHKQEARIAQIMKDLDEDEMYGNKKSSK